MNKLHREFSGMVARKMLAIVINGQNAVFSDTDEDLLEIMRKMKLIKMKGKPGGLRVFPTQLGIELVDNMLVCVNDVAF